MLLLSQSLDTVPVLSLQTGTQLASTSGVILDPATLAIVAHYVEGPGINETPSVLFTQDIREVSDIGYIIDSSDKLMPLDGLVRLQSLIDQDVGLIDQIVIDKVGQKVGKVEDYSYDSDLFVVQQLLVRPPLLERIMNESRIIHRSHIVSVTSEKIVIDESSAKHKRRSSDDAAFTNPFRAPETETQQSA